MFLEKLEIRCFRNYSHLCFFPVSKNLIVGDNGHGKTNLLEALVLLACGKSFRAHTSESLVQEGENSSSILAWISKENKKSTLRLSLEKTGQKKFWINNKKSTRGAMGEELPLIVFSSESLKLLKSFAEHRRDWMDYWLSVCGQAVVVEFFKKALVQKNRILKQIQKREISSEKARILLESANEVFIGKSLALVQARRQSMQDLSLFLEESGAFLFKKQLQKREFEVFYSMKGVALEEIGSKEEEGSLFREKVENSLLREQLVGTSLYGVHRDDLSLFFQGRNSRYFCSQGQQRGLLLALKIAQNLWLHRVQKKSGLLLLDDVFSEIDKHLVFNLLHFLDEFPSQMILTSTKKTPFLSKKKFQVFKLKEGFLRKDTLSERRNQPISNSFPLSNL